MVDLISDGTPKTKAKSSTAQSEFAWHLATACPAMYLLRQNCFPNGPEMGKWDPWNLVRFLNIPRISQLVKTRHPGQPRPVEGTVPI